MDDSIVFLKTAAGEEAIRDRTRLVQRNLRTVLIVVDGMAEVATLKRKVGDAGMVEAALLELELLGFIAPTLEGQDQQPAESVDDEGSGNASLLVEYATDQVDDSPLAVETAAAPEAGFPTSSTTLPDEANGSSSGEVVIDEPSRQPELDDEDVYERAYGIEDPAPAPLIEAAPDNGKKPLSRKTRQRVRAMLAVGLLAAVVLAVFRIVLYPYHEFRPEIENALSRLIDGPARVGEIRVSFMPLPVVTLEKVSLGDTPHTTIDVVRMVAEPVSLFDGDRKFREVRLEGVRIADNGLSDVSRWMSRVALADIGVRAVAVDRLSLTAGNITIGNLAGSAEVGSDRGIDRLSLHSPEGKLKLDVTPAASGLSLIVSAKHWQLPFKPTLLVSALDASASLSAGGVRIERFDGTAFNGHFKGSGAISWDGGAKANIAMTVQNIDAKGILEAWGSPLAVEGSVSGKLVIASSAATLDRLAEHVRLNGSFKASRGSLAGIDLAEALRMPNTRSAGPVRGGRTDFEEFAGTIGLDDRTVRISSVRLDSGRLTASGYADVTRQTGVIAGTAVVGLHASAGQRYSTVALAGTAASPELRAR